MKKTNLAKMIRLFLLVLLALGGNVIKAQDVILIEAGIDGDGKPTLYNTIFGDTLATGERAHPNATYRLSRGQIYPVEAMYIDFDITIDALDGNDRPPMIVPFADGNGVLPYALFNASDTNTMVFKNLLFSGINNAAQKEIGKYAIRVKGGRTIAENCVFNGFNGGGINGMNGVGYDVHVNNCIFRNIQHPSAWWEADAMMFFAATGDSLVITNSTFFNCGGHIVNSNWINYYTNYNEFSNNTVYGGNFCVITSMSQTNSVVKNNLFVNTFAMGIDTSGQKASWVDPQGGIACIVPVDVNDPDKMMNELGLVESDRNIQVHNNVYFWSQDVRNHWASRGEQFNDTVAEFMNERTRAMFEDDVTYPLFNESNNIEVDPGMADSNMEIEVVAGYAKYGTALFDSFLPGGPRFDGYLHHYPGGDGITDVEFFVEWPLAENLSFTNTALKTHASDGGPVGDPRWSSPTAVKNSLASEFELSSYPNPFTDNTKITFTLSETSSIKLSIFDFMGKEIAILVNERKQPGMHSIDWNGTDMSGTKVPAGLYLYKIKMGSKLTAKRLLKVN